MQHRIIYNRFTGSGLFSVLMIIASTVMADDYRYLPYTQYSPQKYADQSDRRRTNPWALPDNQQQSPSNRYFPDYRDQQAQGSQQPPDDKSQDYGREKQGQNFRFVTPETLQSLRQQQTQTQLMPGSNYKQQNNPKRSYRGYNSYTPYSMGYSSPIYDLPAISPWVSPWGGGPDVLYRGESFPLVPNEAIGGMPPIHIPSYDDNSYYGGSNNPTIEKEYDVFNPFSLIPNGDLQ